MTSLTTFNPPEFLYDYAYGFFCPLKTGPDFSYSPEKPDFGTMITVHLKNNAAFFNGETKFDAVGYFVHFFLGLLQIGQQPAFKSLRKIDKIFWYFDKSQKELKISVTRMKKNGRKLLSLKSIHFDPINSKRQWAESDLKSVIVQLHNAGQNVKEYDIENHWYDLWVENMDASESATAPFLFLTFDNEEFHFEDGFVERCIKTKAKAQKNFLILEQLFEEGTPAMGDIVESFQSESRDEVRKGLVNFLKKSASHFKQNINQKVGRELNSLRTASQCGFTHGFLIGVQKQLGFKIHVSPFTDDKGVSYRIKMIRRLTDSWSKIINDVPIKLEFAPNLEKLGKRRELFLEEEAQPEAAVEKFFMESLNPEMMAGFVNYNAEKRNYKIFDKIPIVILDKLTLLSNLAVDVALATSDNKPAKKRLKTFVDMEFSYVLRADNPSDMKEKLGYLPSFLHGSLSSHSSCQEDKFFRLHVKSPNEYFKGKFNFFLMKTKHENVNLIINLYENDDITSEEFLEVSRYLLGLKYPKVDEHGVNLVIADFFTCYTQVKKPEYKRHIVGGSKVYLKQPFDQEVSDFQVDKINHINMFDEIGNALGSESMKNPKVMKGVLSKMKNYFLQNSHLINTETELKGMLEGLLQRVYTLSSIVDVRKGAFQIGFLNDMGQVCIINIAYNAPEKSVVILDDVRQYFESGLIKDKERAKMLNIAISETDQGKMITAADNEFLSVLSMCSRLRVKRDIRCKSNEVKSALNEAAHTSKQTPREKFRRVYLENLNKFSAGIMYGLMAKDFVSDLIHGNMVGMAVNAGFLLSSVLTSQLADKLLSKTAILAASDRLLLSNILKASAPFLRRTPTFAFVGFDLYNSIQAYRQNQNEAIVNIVADSSYLALDLAETAIEITEAFGFFEGVSTVTGPIGWAVGAALLVGADIYRSVKTVEKLDETVHLTKLEKFTEGIRSFFGMDPEKHVAELMKQKQFINDTINSMQKFLDQHDTIKRYIFPINVHSQLSATINIDLKYKKKIQLSRSVPKLTNGNKYFCLWPLQDDYASSKIFVTARYCENAIGLESAEPKPSNITYIQLGHNSAFARAMPSDANIFDITGNGSKILIGGNADDRFIVRNNQSWGYYDGLGGDNILDVSHLTARTVFFTSRTVSHRNYKIKLGNITSIIGRRNMTDRVKAWCRIKHIDLQGGRAKGGPDHITIPHTMCDYNMKLVITGAATRVSNYASSGNFLYIITNTTGNFHIKFYTLHRGSHTFLFNYPSYILKHIKAIKSDGKLLIVLKWGKGQVGRLSLAESVKYIFQDGTVQLYHKKLLLNVTTSQLIDEALPLYIGLAKRSKISVILHSITDKKTLTLNHHSFNKEQSKYSVDIFNDVQGHHNRYKSVAHESIYVLESRNSNLTINNLTIELSQHKRHKVILDLNKIREQCTSQGKNLEVQPVFDRNRDILLVLKLNNNGSSTTLSTITLMHALHGNLSHTVLLRNKIPYLLNINNNSNLELIHVPLQFSFNDNLILISEADGVDFHSSVQFDRYVTKFDYFNMNDTHLMLTNVLWSAEKGTGAPFTLILANFYSNNIMKSLKLVFNNRVVNVEDISRACDTVKPVNYLTKRLILEYYH
uniref:Uncharacterized protein n=1 Tax=Romanomermis culicivorax TaxID=13658 RepID=A0A915I2Y5_ROMCU